MQRKGGMTGFKVEQTQSFDQNMPQEVTPACATAAGEIVAKSLTAV
jgi:hypothetical protein